MAKQYDEAQTRDVRMVSYTARSCAGVKRGIGRYIQDRVS